MQKKIKITSAQWETDRLIFTVDPTDFNFEEWKPHQHMLVDSDHLAFIYILESTEEFCYVMILSKFWPFCKEMLQEQKKAYIRWKGKDMELEHMQEELTYLIQNIKGNANYGEKLVNEVEEVFL